MYKIYFEAFHMQAVKNLKEMLFYYSEKIDIKIEKILKKIF
jgi:hypothetical protein